MLTIVPYLVVIVFFTFLAISQAKNAKKQVHNAGTALQDVASQIGLQADPSATLDTGKATLMKLGGKQEIRNAFSGSWDGKPIRMYDFVTVVSGERNSETLYFSIIEITYPYTLPHVLMAPHIAFNSYDSFGGVKIDLGPETNKLIGRIETTHGYEQEVYELLTPEIIAWLVANKVGFNAELYNNKMYVYSESLLEEDAFTVLWNKTQAFSKLAEPKFEEMSGDVKAMEEVTAPAELVS